MTKMKLCNAENHQNLIYIRHIHTITTQDFQSSHDRAHVPRIQHRQPTFAQNANNNYKINVWTAAKIWDTFVFVYYKMSAVISQRSSQPTLHHYQRLPYYTKIPTPSSEN